MIKFELVRKYLPKGTNGKIFLDGKLICHSIELAWRNNIPKISCIPEGIYQIVRRYSNRYKNHYWIKNVPNRSLILIHPANNANKELQGCIAPVLNIVNDGVGEYSKKAFQILAEYIDPFFESDKQVFIHIKNSQNESI